MKSNGDGKDLELTAREERIVSKAMEILGRKYARRRRAPKPKAQDVSRSDMEAFQRVARTVGRLGGLKGGPARAAALSPERRREIARNAALARHGKTRKRAVSKPRAGRKAS